jgi:hypothetical protein
MDILSDWLVAAVLVFAGLIAAAGIYMARQDPEIWPYTPTIAALFQLGRTRLRPVDSDKSEKSKEQKDRE